MRDHKVFYSLLFNYAEYLEKSEQILKVKSNKVKRFFFKSNNIFII